MTPTIVNVGYRSTNFWVVSVGTSRLLVDLGWPGMFKAREANLKRADIPLREIRHGLATHYHIDHAGAAQDLKAKGMRLLVVEEQVYAIPLMKQAGGGAIVNISSISGFVGQDQIHMAYNASKGAVRIMTKSAAVQYAKDGIRVNSVHPGFMPPMRTSKTSADPAWRDKMLRAVPMKRAGRVEEVAHAVLFLASDEASYITGTELVVDGGYLAV